jgi:hypothetical protein
MGILSLYYVEYKCNDSYIKRGGQLKWENSQFFRPVAGIPRDITSDQQGDTTYVEVSLAARLCEMST